MAEPRASDEEYLQTLFELEEDGVPLVRIRLAEHLGISPAAASEAVLRLAERGYVVDSGDRRLRLTEGGRRVALTVVRRHRLAECLLVEVLGLAWEQAHREAARWEHVISEDVEERLVDILGDPATCPHGNAIPHSRRAPDTRPTLLLARAPAGSVVVARISEHIQLDEDALHLLARAGLLPGAAATILATTEDGVTVRTPTGDHLVPGRVADQMWVAPV